MSGGQFRFVTRVNVNVDGIAGVDNAVERIVRAYPRLLSELNIVSGTQLDLRELCSSTVLDCKVYFGDSYRGYEDALKGWGL